MNCMKKVFFVVCVITLCFAGSLSGGESWSPTVVVDRSPTIGFIKSPNAPARLLYNKTLTDANGPEGKVRLVLEIRPTQDVAVAKFVAICVEEFQRDDSKNIGIRKTSHYFSGGESGEVYFDVTYSSDFTFLLESVTLEDGTVWVNK